MHQPAKVTQMISVMEHFWIDAVSVANCARQVHQTQHNRGLEGQTILARIVGENSHNNSWEQTDCQVSWWQGSIVFSPQPMFSRCRYGSACSADGEEKPSVH